MQTEDSLAILRGRLMSSLRRRSRSAPDWAEDMVQETLARVLVKYPDVGSRTDAAQIAFGFARNVLRELLRERSRYDPLGDDDSRIEGVQSDGPTPEARERCLAAAMKRLPRACKALLQAMLNGRKNADIAELLGINVNALYQRQHNCYKTVREIMKTTPECEGICHA